MKRKKQLRGFFDFGRKPTTVAPARVDLYSAVAKAELCTVGGNDSEGHAKYRCRSIEHRRKAPKRGQRLLMLCPKEGSCLEYVVGK